MIAFIHRCAALALLCVLAVPASADTPQPAQQHNSNAVWFENWRGLNNAHMKVVQPDGTITEIFAERGTPVFRLEGREVLDGIYRYQLSAATEERQKIINPVNNGRGDAARDDRAVPYYLTGYFTVSRGVIITPKEIKEE